MISSQNIISITTDQIYQFYDDTSAFASLAETKQKINMHTRNIEEQELLFLSKNPICSLPKLNSTPPLSNSAELKPILNDDFYNITVIGENLCISESIFYGDSHNIGLSKNMKIRYWIAHLQTKTTLQNPIINTLIVKISKDYNNLQHELFITLFCTNTLRGLVPNFSYIFGGFRCSKDKKIKYLLCEGLTPNISMKEYVKTCKGIDFINKYLQVIYALKIAHSKYEFTHYNLHADNVLIKDTGVPISAIPYIINEKTEYIITDKIATLIDYSNSFIRYEGKPYGVFTLSNYGISGTSGFPMYDCYKLLGFCMYEMLEAKNMECFNVASRIMRFFNQTEDLTTLILAQRKIIYILPSNSEFRNVSYDTFLNYIRNQNSIDTSFIVSDPYKTPILQCEFDGISLTSNPNYIIPDNFYDFYDLSQQLLTENKNTDFQVLYDNFGGNYETAKSKILDQIEDNINIVKNGASKLISPYISSYKDALQGEILNLFKIFTLNTMKVFEAFYNLRILEQLFTNVSTLYQNSDSVNIQRNAQIFVKYNDVLNLYTYLSNASKIIINVINILHNNENRNEREAITQIITANPEFTWYFKDLISYSIILRSQIY